MSEANRPIHTVYVENIGVSIFPNENDKGKYYTFSAQKSYKDEQGNRQYTNTFGFNDLLNLAKAADLAHTCSLGLKQEWAQTR